MVDTSENFNSEWGDDDTIKKYEKDKNKYDDLKPFRTLHFNPKIWVPGLFTYYQLKELKENPTFEDMTNNEKNLEYTSILFGEIMLDLLKAGAAYIIYKSFV